MIFAIISRRRCFAACRLRRHLPRRRYDMPRLDCRLRRYAYFRHAAAI